MSQDTFQKPGMTDTSSPMHGNNETSIQTSVAQIWAEVLHVSSVQPSDNFFDLGGDSLKAMEVISRLQGSLNVAIPLITFFEDPTVIHISEVVQSLLPEQKGGNIDDVQAVIAQVWAEVLHLPDVKTTDNFFDLGGDSLKAMEVISRLQSLLDVAIPLVSFFEDPTVAHASEVVAQLRSEEAVPVNPPAEAVGSAPLSFPQLTFWLLQQSDPAGYLYNEPRVLRIRGRMQADILQQALDEMCNRHDILRTRFEPGADEPQQIVDRDGRIELSVEDLSGVPASARETAALASARREAQRPFDLFREFPVRLRLIKLDAEDYVMTVVIHHVLNDGQTSAVFFEELSTIYNSLAAGMKPALPQPSRQYREYASWERSQMQGARLESELGFWRDHLNGAPPKLDLPADKRVRGGTSYRGASRRLTITPESLEKIKAVARENGSTLFTVLLGGLRILLHRWTNQEDIVIGTVAGNRSWAGTERTLGCFLNFLPLRTRINPQGRAQELLDHEWQTVTNAFAHQACPFVKIAAAVDSARQAESNPIYNVAFLLQSFPEMKFACGTSTTEFIEFAEETALLDLRFIAQEVSEGLEVECEYKTDLFDSDTIKLLLHAYVAVLDELTTQSNRAIAEIAILPELAARAKTARRREQKRPVVIASTFTAEPVQASLEFWMEELDLRPSSSFAPYNQVFQQLLDPASEISQNRDGYNVLLLRFTDWIRFEEHASNDSKRQVIERSARELADALKGRHSQVPHLLCICPSDPTYSSDPEWTAFLESTESSFIAQLTTVPGIHVITKQQILERYPVRNVEDEYADALGHIPYGTEFFAAMGSMLARRLFGLLSAPKKVIVLDCDNTLWKGVCGEDGAKGVSVDTPRRVLQEFMLAQARAGMLLCLCSKNAQEDVEAVFNQNPGMVLRAEDIVAQRINWNSKSQNLRELAQDLQLGLDSFVFIDDNPIECAEVKENCPEVLPLLLPEDPAQIPQFLRSVWVFDHWKVTQEDAQRADMYRRNAEREQVRRQASSLDGFLAGLELKIEIRPMADADLARVAQLTERTNQFNLTTIRRGETEIVKFTQDGGDCLIVNVRDRFGDYGLVGVILFRGVSNALEIDTFLLSCRVLGRKVEHEMLARLGEIATERKLSQVVARLVQTKKNQPAFDFLNGVGQQFQKSSDSGLSYSFPTAYAIGVRLAQLQLKAGTQSGTSAEKTKDLDGTSYNSVAAKIAGELRDVNSILRAMDSHRNTRSAKAAFLLPRTPLEEMLAGIWAQLLKLERVGIHDDFFLLGGHSLLATQAMARVRRVVNVELPLRAIFEAPTVAELAARIESTQRSGNSPQLPSIARLANHEHLPLSFAQKRLWFLDQLEPGNPAYNVPLMFRIHGALDIDALRQSLNRIVQRHESLRTTFAVENNEPVQIIADQLELPLPIRDFSGLPASEQERQVQQIAAEIAERPFNLTAGPLLRAELLRQSAEDFLLVLTMHHIVSDRWSLGVLSEELATNYAACAAGEAPSLPELQIQYSDYSAWQREWLQGDLVQKQINYWKKQLAGAPAVLEIPVDRARPAVMSGRGATQSQLIPQELVARLTKLSQNEGVTLFMTLLAAFQTLLSRYSSQEDIVVGSPIANRSIAEIEPLIGFFVNTLALRGDLSGDPTFRDLVSRVKETCLQAYAHQDVPFEKLVEELQPERSLSHSPIFQVMFALQNTPAQTLKIPRLELERIPLYTKTSMFDMSWFALDAPDGLIIRAEYSTDVFEDPTIARALGHFRQLLESVAANPDIPISQLSVLSASERQQVLVDFNSNEVDFELDTRLHGYVERTAAKTPQSTAVVCGSAHTTYLELNRRANQIAHHLIRLGAGPEILVGVFLERNSDLLPAILGVLKSGSAYVPLDPNYPEERIAAILADAKAPIVITQRSLSNQLAGSDAKVVCLDDGGDQIARESVDKPAVAVKPQNLAYVLFTSGSTGRPKGVAIEHRSAATFVQWAQTVFSPGELSGVLFSTSVCFDLSIFEMFAPLSVGGKIIVTENALYLPSAESRNEVTLINTVPSAMAELVRSKSVPGSVRTINLAGEALPLSLVNEIYSSTSATKVYNLYGPTEDTTYSTYTLTAPNTRVTIGKPLPNSQAYILDSKMNPVPIGVPGELYLAGAGLARGYFGRPDLTQERFIPNPFGSSKNPRMYKTGDLCRWLPDGQIEYLGRLDHQIKLRGFRIELGEVEAVLAEHPGVQQSLVMAREDSPGLKRLVAYLVPKTQAPPSNDELAAHLKQRLPEFMIPSAFVTLAAIPLTPNGKVDRKALPAPEYEERGERTAPRNPIEEVVAGVWAEVLHVEGVSVEDNFFELGGHSLLATQVISRLRQAFQIELPLRAVFEAPTVAGLAALIAGTKQTPQAPPLRSAPRSERLPLSFAQQRLWFLNQLEPNNPLYNIPVAIGMSGTLDFDALVRALDEIVRRHEVLRTTFAISGNQPIQVIAPQQHVEVPIIGLDHLPADQQQSEVKRLAIEGAREIFDLETGPLFRAKLLRLREDEHVLLLNMHHIVSDGWSMWQFIREIAPLYGAFIEGKPSPLPELQIQYADFAVWQREWMSGDVLDQHLAYWTKQLQAAPGVFELPSDRVRPSVQTYRGATLTRKFPLELLQRLRTLSQSEGATLFMTLLAAYQTLLFRYTGQEDMVVGSPIAGRNRTEIESLIGFFVNAIVLRTDLSGSPTFRELLQRVRTVALDAYAHQELPFEKLVETLQPDRDLTRTPIFQVWFVLQNAPRADFKLQGVDLCSLDVHNGTSKFDLGLFVVEKPDGLQCMVEYSTDLFDESTIERFLAHYRVLLEGIAQNPNRSIAEFPILDESERQQVVVDWNKTQVDYPRDRCLHQLIEERVEKTPDAPALIFESQQLTYRELNSRANQLAHRLRKHGVGPDTLVGVCAERSVEMVVALLGTMKAGGAYMPLDPDHPRERLAMVLEDASPAVLLTQEKLLEVLPSQSAPVICLDRDWSDIANEPASNPVCITSGKDQAYAIFTSGSTGRPKGVPNVHEGIVNRLLWMQHAYRLDSSDRVLQKTPYSFDVSVWEFFWPLLTGACLVVAKPEGHKDPNYLIDVIARNHITTMHFVPSMLRVFLESDGVERCTSLRRVICSGEALPMDLQVRFFERCKAELHNLYGPTEASVDVTYWQCVPEDHHTTVPIGRPIWNTQIYILDSRLQPVPIGVPGELHIGGVGLARGYLNRPQLTAEKFISDPFSREPGARLYKTGDLARFLDDGTIEYLGRLDHQVKIRGFRIELGEIEAALNAHGAVQQTIVIAREDEPGDKRLAAYIVVNPDYQGSSEDASADMVSTEQVSQWAMTFDEAYTRGESVEDATFNIKGWNSSYTGEAIPAEEMRVWVNTTVDRILALHPQRIWEIGCGTGLLLFRIAPKTSYFRGTDISQRALDFLRQQLSRLDLHLPQVQLARSAAHEFGDERESFDTIVLNSVIQYFPNLEYLVRVLTGASNSLGNNGRIFIGDVRNFPLLETFHASVELFRASDSASCKEVWDRAQKNLKQEGELVVDPDFFLTLSQRIPQIRRVEIHLKRGHAQNELTRFRYDVVLHVGEAGIPEANCHWLDWNKDVTTIDALRDLLTKSDSDFVGVTSLPNSRLWRESSAVQMLTSGGFATIGDLRNQLERDHAPSIELEELWDLENSLPFTIELRWGRKAPATCDILFRRKHPAGASSSQVVKFPGEPATARPLHTYATNPLRQRFTGTLTAELKRDLANTLPEYMVPAHFVLLDSMPLSPNGKVDRKQLPAPDRKSDAAGNYIAPHTPTEQILASIWAEVLRIEAIGIQDNFFDLGGHSLSATRVVARVRQAFAVDLPLRKLFETPTIAELANAIEDMKRTEMTEAPPMVRASREQQLPLSFAQQRLWFLDQMDPGNWLYNIPRAIRLSGKLYVSAMKSALNGLIQRHEILRTTYHTVDDHPVQIIAPKLEIDLPVLDLSTLPTSHREAKARDIVQKESAKGFALATDPMLRGLIIKLDEQDHVLFLNTHHIASDGWSTGVMMNDLAELYRAALENRASELPELNIQYADYACWQRNWLQGEVLAKQAAYWKSRLEGAPPVLSIPPDHSRPAVQDFSGSVFESVVPKSLVAGLRVLGRQQGTTMFMTMLAAFKTLLHHYTSQTDIVIGTDLANRATVETEALIGFFVNLLVLRTDLSGNPTFEELASRVREVSLNAYAHQDLPFDKLVEELSPERSLSHSPIVQVLFVQQNTPRAVDSMPGLKTSSFKLDVPAKFDVAAFVNEGENEATIRWVYNSSLFNQGTIARMAANYELLVRTIIVDPTLRLESLRELLAHHEKQHRGTEQKKFAEAGLEKLKKTRRKSVAEI